MCCQAIDGTFPISCNTSAIPREKNTLWLIINTIIQSLNWLKQCCILDISQPVKKYPNAELVSSKPRCKTHWHLYVLWVLFLLLGPFSRNLISVFQTLRHCQQYIHHAYTNHSFLLLLTAQWKLTYILSNSLSTYLNRYSSIKDPTIKPVDSNPLILLPIRQRTKYV